MPAKQTVAVLKWKEGLVEGLHRSGALGLSEKVAESHELLLRNRTPWPRIRRARMPRFAILCYHRIGEGGIPFYSGLPAKRFESQIRYLRSRYRVISLEQMIEEMSHPEEVLPAVAITFDDGYRDLFTCALPILQAYRVPATVFLTAGCIETGEVAWYDRVFLALRVAPGNVLELVLDGPRRFVLPSESARMDAAVEIIRYLRGLSCVRRHELCAALERQVPLPADQLRDRMLSWEQIRAMDSAGISFGSHTISHPVVSRLTQTELERELVESKRMIEHRVGHAVDSFAFPFGKREDYGALPRQLLLSAGYQSAVTTEWGINTSRSDPLELNRVSVGEYWPLAMFAFQLNRLFLCVPSEGARAKARIPSQPDRAAEEAGIETR